MAGARSGGSLSAVSEPLRAANAAFSLSAAQDAIAAGIGEAESLGISVSLAVVDAGGVLKAFARMDGAEIAGEVLAVDKAYTACAHRCPTADLAEAARPGGELAGLHANGGGRYIVFGGGLPVVARAPSATSGSGSADSPRGTVVGGVGVSGGAAVEDVRCAEAVLAVLTAAIS